MWWETYADCDFVRQNVFLRCPPTPSVGTGAPATSGIGDGAYPRDRRTIAGAPPDMRVTLSSHLVEISRSFSRNASATLESRWRASASRYAIGSSLMLPLVITSGRP